MKNKKMRYSIEPRDRIYVNMSKKLSSKYESIT